MLLNLFGKTLSMFLMFIKLRQCKLYYVMINNLQNYKVTSIHVKLQTNNHTMY